MSIAGVVEHPVGDMALTPMVTFGATQEVRMSFHGLPTIPRVLLVHEEGATGTPGEHDSA